MAIICADCGGTVSGKNMHDHHSIQLATDEDASNGED